MIEECTKLREISPFHLVKGDIHLFNESKYPFKNLVPAMCQVTDKKPFDGMTYQSCNRSLVFPFEGAWLKCKAIGIPIGISQPFLIGDNIYTYRLLDDPTIGYDVANWGFHSNQEYEILGMKTAYENGLPSPEPVGWAEYKNLFALDVRDKHEIFRLRKTIPNEKMVDHMLRHSKRVKGGCIFCIEKSNIRVDEILSAFAYSFAREHRG